jgi:choline monooxygenase
MFPDPARLADPAFDRALRDRVLARSWRWAGHVDRLAAGDGATPTPWDDEPLVVTRSGDRLRLLSNVCTHRWHPLVAEPSACRVVRCPYHGRRFGLDGRVQGAPGFEGVEGFPTESDHLPEVALTDWHGHLFGNLAPEGAPALPELDLPWDRATLGDETTYQVDAHWTLYVENYLEGLHIPFVHRGLAAALDLAAYRTELHPWGVLQRGPTANAADAFPHDLTLAGLYAWIFPTTMVNAYPWGVSLNSVEPLLGGRTRIRYVTWVWDPSRRGIGAGADLARVEAEDDGVVEAVARGARARLARRTGYAPGWEDGVAWFHARLAEMLG